MASGEVPDIDPVAMGRLKDAELAQIIDQMNAPNPALTDMNLPPGLLEDGAS